MPCVWGSRRAYLKDWGRGGGGAARAATRPGRVLAYRHGSQGVAAREALCRVTRERQAVKTGPRTPVQRRDAPCTSAQGGVSEGVQASQPRFILSLGPNVKRRACEKAGTNIEIGAGPNQVREN